jgi:hypothetical protein
LFICCLSHDTLLALQQLYSATMVVNEDQIAFFEKNGYIIIRDFLSLEQVTDMQRWAQEVHDWTPSDTSEFMPYEVRLSLFKIFRL